MQAIRALISIETYSGNQEAIFGMMDVILNLKAVHLYVYPVWLSFSGRSSGSSS
ncbi:hypothetical protein YC2023_076284 [Brassica napus]